MVVTLGGNQVWRDDMGEDEKKMSAFLLNLGFIRKHNVDAIVNWLGQPPEQRCAFSQFRPSSLCARSVSICVCVRACACLCVCAFEV